MTGSEYSNLIASYLVYNYGDRGLVATAKYRLERASSERTAASTCS